MTTMTTTTMTITDTVTRGRLILSDGEWNLFAAVTTGAVPARGLAWVERADGTGAPVVVPSSRFRSIAGSERRENRG